MRTDTAQSQSSAKKKLFSAGAKKAGSTPADKSLPQGILRAPSRVVPEKLNPAANSGNLMANQTIQCEDLTWNFVGKPSTVTEKPAGRDDIMAVEESYELAMKNLSHNEQADNPESKNDSGNKQPTAFDQDMHNFMGQV